MTLPTTIIGSLPRPSWYTENLGSRSFLDAMVDIAFREQYEDALAVYLRDQEVAGLDIVTGRGQPYTAPKARMRATEILVRGFMFKFRTMKIGRMPTLLEVTAHAILGHCYEHSRDVQIVLLAPKSGR